MEGGVSFQPEKESGEGLVLLSDKFFVEFLCDDSVFGCIFDAVREKLTFSWKLDDCHSWSPKVACAPSTPFPHCYASE